MWQMVKNDQFGTFANKFLNGAHDSARILVSKLNERFDKINA